MFASDRKPLALFMMRSLNIGPPLKKCELEEQ